MNVSNYVFFSKKCPSCGTMDIRMCVDWDYRTVSIGCANCGNGQTRPIPPEMTDEALRARLERRNGASR